MTSEPRQSRVATFDPILRDDGEPEAMFPRPVYTRSAAITEAREEWFYRFESYRRDELHAKAAAVRYATQADLDSGMFDNLEDEEQVGSYIVWCDPSEEGAMPAWMVCPRSHR